MSTRCEYRLTVTVAETPETNVPAAPASSRVNLHTLFNTSKSLDGTTTPAVSKNAIFDKALVAGAGTIDLTALTAINNLAVTFSGLKVQVWKFKAKSGNAAAVTIKFGSANPYNLLGTSWLLTLEPGQELGGYTAGAAPVVGASAKNIDLTGTGTDAVEVSLVAG